MFKKTTFALLVLVLALATPLMAFASGGGGVTVVINGTQFYYDGTEDPLARLHEAWILPCGEDPIEGGWYYYYEWGAGGHPDDIWVDMGFPIAMIEYNWHYGEAGSGDYWGFVEGFCGIDHGATVTGPLLGLVDANKNVCALFSNMYWANPDSQERLCKRDIPTWDTASAKPFYLGVVFEDGYWGGLSMARKFMPEFALKPLPDLIKTWELVAPWVKK